MTTIRIKDPDLELCDDTHVLPPEIQELMRKTMNIAGELASSHPKTGATISGVYYTIENQNYVFMPDSGCVYLYKNFPNTEITDPEIIGKIEALTEEDELIQNARQQAVEILAKSDVMRDILRMHMEFTGGEIEPIEKDDIVFYQVGRNASHEFYAGYKDGQKYVYTCGETWDSENDPHTPGTEEKITPVNEWGYMGHR